MEGIILDNEGDLHALLTGDKSRCEYGYVSSLADEIRDRRLGEEITVQEIDLDLLDRHAMLHMRRDTIIDQEANEDGDAGGFGDDGLTDDEVGVA